VGEIEPAVACDEADLLRRVGAAGVASDPRHWSRWRTFASRRRT
jgi:hypothetical protein